MIEQVKKIRFTDSQTLKLLEWAHHLEMTSLTQGTGLLRRLKDSNEQYCCLGIYVKCVHPTTLWKRRNVKGVYALRSGKIWQPSFLPLKFQKELGLHRRSIFNRITLQECFSQLNDHFKYNFLEIAKEIRHLVGHGTFTPETMKEMGNFYQPGA